MKRAHDEGEAAADALFNSGAVNLGLVREQLRTSGLLKRYAAGEGCVMSELVTLTTEETLKALRHRDAVDAMIPSMGRAIAVAVRAIARSGVDPSDPALLANIAEQAKEDCAELLDEDCPEGHGSGLSVTVATQTLEEGVAAPPAPPVAAPTVAATSTAGGAHNWQQAHGANVRIYKALRENKVEQAKLSALMNSAVRAFYEGKKSFDEHEYGIPSMLKTLGKFTNATCEFLADPTIGALGGKPSEDLAAGLQPDGREEDGLLLAVGAGSDSPHGMAVMWVGGPLRTHVAFLVAEKPKRGEDGAVEIVWKQLWMTGCNESKEEGEDEDDLVTAATPSKLEQQQARAMIQVRLAAVLVMMYDVGYAWDTSLVLSRTSTEKTARLLKKLQFGACSAPEDTKTLAHEMWNGNNLSGHGYRFGNLLRHLLHACPVPPPVAAMRWRAESYGAASNRDAMGLFDCSRDFEGQTRSVYAMVAIYQLDGQGEPIIPRRPPAGTRDIFERQRENARGEPLVSLICGRGKVDARLAFYNRQALKLGIQSFHVEWTMDFPRAELPMWERRFIDCLPEGLDLVRKAWFGVGGGAEAPSGMKEESFFGHAGDSVAKVLRFSRTEKVRFEEQFRDLNIPARGIQI